ncbi:MAG TPA: hypothetical protein ENI23_13215 [bacterium]|nr:hypothetical protein [bacterium]
MEILNKSNNNQQGERARIRKEDSTNNIGDPPTPKSSLAINGDGSPVDSYSQTKKTTEKKQWNKKTTQ